MGIKSIAAKTNDSNDIWMWRNNVTSRMMSINTSRIPWNDHNIWFKKILTSHDKLIFIGIDDESEKIGMSRFDLSAAADTAEVSINLNPLMRGRKLSVPFLTKSIEAFWALHPVPLTATIRKDNSASIHCFEACGFTQTHDDSTFTYYRLTPPSV